MIDRSDKVPYKHKDHIVSNPRSSILRAIWVAVIAIQDLKKGDRMQMVWNPLREANPFALETADLTKRSQRQRRNIMDDWEGKYEDIYTKCKNFECFGFGLCCPGCQGSEHGTIGKHSTGCHNVPIDWVEQLNKEDDVGDKEVDDVSDGLGKVSLNANNGSEEDMDVDETKSEGEDSSTLGIWKADWKATEDSTGSGLGEDLQDFNMHPETHTNPFQPTTMNLASPMKRDMRIWLQGDQT